MNPVLILDIDGVARPDVKPNDYKLDAVCVKLINQLVTELQAHILISSNWRLAYPLEFFNKVFNGKVIGMTPDLAHENNHEHVRWKEIHTSLSAHYGNQIPPYWIVDDNRDLFPAKANRLLLCNPATGFSQSDYDYLRAQFNGTQPVSECVSTIVDLDEKIKVTIQLSRRELNTLTQVAGERNHESALRWAALECIHQYQSLEGQDSETPSTLHSLYIVEETDCVNHPIHVHHSKNVKGRDFFIGDIHGYFTDLSDVLDTVKFDRSVDRLFCTGDLIDRGPQSMQCLQLVNEPWFFPVRGNHEDMLLDVLTSTDSSKVNAEFIHKANGGKWYSSSNEKPEDAVTQEMLGRIPYFRTVQTAKGDIGLVHAAWIKSWKEAQNLATLSEKDMQVANWTRLDESVLTPVADIQLVVTGHQNLTIPHKTENMLCIDTLGRSGSFTLLSADQVLAAVTLPEGPVDTELLL